MEGDIDKEKLVAEFSTLLPKLEEEAAAASRPVPGPDMASLVKQATTGPQRRPTTRSARSEGGGQANAFSPGGGEMTAPGMPLPGDPSALGMPGIPGMPAAAGMPITGAPGMPGAPGVPGYGARPEDAPVRPTPILDSFTQYEELKLADGRVLRRYDTGAVRVENPKSGIIQEERADGSLLVSMPNGRVIFQEFRGEPLLVYDTEAGGAPGLARVCSATMPGETTAKFVFHFQDRDGNHLIELETLRYYRVKAPQQGG